MFERIVVPVDFTDESERAIVVAPTLAGLAGARVELLSVAEPDDVVPVDARLAIAASEVGPGTTWRVVASGGPVGPVLVTQLQAGADEELWCVGTHARGALGELLLGSLSEQFVRAAHAPVVLVGPHVTGSPGGTVLAVALDGGDDSEAILPVAAGLATALGLTVRLLQVSGSRSDEFPGDAAETSYLARVAAGLPSVAHETVDYDVLHGGHPAHNLADYVAAHADVAMVAMATRGLSGRDRLRHHSTAFDVAHRTTIPVLILHHA